MPNDADELVHTVRKLRTALDDTQQDFAHRLSLSIATVVRYEHNRPPSGKALAKLEQVAAAHGLDEYAAVFRRALSNELGAPPPVPTGFTLQVKDEHEKLLASALLDVLRRPQYCKEAKAVKRILSPITSKRTADVEFFEALEASQMGIMRLLKSGHSAAEIQSRTGMSAEMIAKAFFDRGGPKVFGSPKMFEDKMCDVVGLLLKDHWDIKRMADEFGNGDVQSFLTCAHQLGAYEAISDYERSV